MHGDRYPERYDVSGGQQVYVDNENDRNLVGYRSTSRRRLTRPSLCICKHLHEFGVTKDLRTGGGGCRKLRCRHWLVHTVVGIWNTKSRCGHSS